MMKKNIFNILFCILFFTNLLCANVVNENNVNNYYLVNECQSITIKAFLNGFCYEDEFDMCFGEYASLCVYDENEQEIDDTITWSSSNKSTVIIDENGNASVVGGGVAIITATLPNGISDTIKITVPEVEKIQIGRYVLNTNNEYEINFNNFKLERGYGEYLSVFYGTDGYVDPNIVSWTSSDKNVATVDEDGFVYAKALGKVTIKATLKNGVSDTITVTVFGDILPESISLDKESLLLKVGKTAQLRETVLPENAVNKTVTWSSSNENVATVKNGKVKAVAVGYATIVVSTNEGGLEAFCEVRVKDDTIEPTDISLDNNTLNLDIKKTTKLKATVYPDNAKDKTVTWYSSDETIATVSNDGTVKALKYGTAYIFAMTNNNLYAICEVVVKKTIIKVESVELNKINLLLQQGKITTLIAAVRPSNATDQSVSWKSNNTKIATVDEYGNVKGIKEGTATITVTTNDGKKIATCEVTVIKSSEINVTSVKLNKTSLSIIKGKTETLLATVSPSKATDKTVTWKSSDKSIATVDSKGVVKGVNLGTATITVITNDGKKFAKCIVKVKPVSVTGVHISPSALTVYVGKTSTVKATVSPSSATYKKVTWKSSHPKVATVDQNGVIKGIKKGTATITAVTNGKDKKGRQLTATCVVTVKKVRVKGVKLDKTSISIATGKSVSLKAIVSPSDATVKTVLWTSSNNKIATVDQNGKVKAIKKGTVTIKVTTKDGSRIATCIITVK